MSRIVILGLTLILLSTALAQDSGSGSQTGGSQSGQDLTDLLNSLLSGTTGNTQTGGTQGSGTQTGATQGSGSQNTGLQPFDACGTLVRGTHCVLFDGGGGKYYVPNTGHFKVGDAVRAVGTLDPGCRTICSDADGCISGGVLYDPANFPCGSALPSFPDDILTGAANSATSACTTASGSLLLIAIGGMCFTRRRRGR